MDKSKIFSAEVMVCRHCGSGKMEGQFIINPNRPVISEVYPADENENWCCRCDNGVDLDSYPIDTIPEEVFDKWWSFQQQVDVAEVRAKFWSALSYSEKQLLWLADILSDATTHHRQITPCCCPECGSDNVEAKVWLRPNNRNEYVKDCCEDEDYCSCNECFQEITLTHPSEADKDINKWWNQQGFKAMESITGFRQSDFSPENGYQDFVDACNDLWNNFSRIEKFEKRNDNE